MAKIVLDNVELPCSIVQEVSQKTGNPYHQILIDVDEHYTLKLFLSAEQAELVRTKLAG